MKKEKTNIQVKAIPTKLLKTFDKAASKQGSDRSKVIRYLMAEFSTGAICLPK